jgi:hypothetical protein
MQESTLFEALQSLTAWELKNFKKWVQSPAHNPREDTARLFDFFEKCLKNNISPEKDAAMKVVFGPKSDEKNLRRAMSSLLDLLRDFLVWLQMEQEPIQKDVFFLRQCRARGLSKNFNLAEKEAEKALEKHSSAQLSVLLSDFQLNFEKHQWEISQRRQQDFPFEKISQQLNAWYAGQLMQLTCMEMSHHNFQRQEKTSKSAWTQALVQQLPEMPHENVPAVALYFKGYQMLHQPQDVGFLKEFQAMLAQYSSDLPIAEGRGLLMLAINQGIRRINEGDKTAIQDTLDFYLLGLENKLLLDDRGVLSKHTYNNVLMTFLALKDWESGLVFLEKYREQLAPSERENIYQYNLAVYHYRKGDFDATLDLLRNVTFPDVMYNLESRKMLLKIYFEQDAYDALESLIDNLLTWLRRHGELGYHREMFRNLAIFTRKMLRLLPNDRKGRASLEKRILDTPLVVERAWLLEKLRK